jgi:parallel beta-helix repeat protein
MSSAIGQKGTVIVVTLTTMLIATLSASPANADTQLTHATCPIVIAEPGSYQLETDVACLPGVDGIVIRASRVRLRLNGHMISGSPVQGTCSTGVGIRIGSYPGAALSRVRVEGEGTIENFATGIRAQNTTASRVRSVTVTAECPFGSIGLHIASPGSDWKLQGNVVREQAQSTGIALDGVDDNVVVGNDVNDTISLGNSSGNTIVNNTANGLSGILLLAGSHDNEIHANTTNDDPESAGIGLFRGATHNNITGNTALGNAVDLVDLNADCDSNTWKGNHFGSANQACIH